jgi:hypothetical protein
MSSIEGLGRFFETARTACLSTPNKKNQKEKIIIIIKIINNTSQINKSKEVQKYIF